MATTCPECAQKFTARTALCEDWTDPERSFGCPHCGTYFIKDMNPNRKQEWIETLFVVGMLLPAVNVLFRQLFHDADPFVVVNTLSIVIAAAVIIALKHPKLFSPLIKSPYNEVINEQAE